MSQIWEVFINNCKQRYYPGENITIGEQLLAFSGRCQQLLIYCVSDVYTEQTGKIWHENHDDM